MMSSRLLIDEPPLLVIPGLAKVVGLNEAIVLQQVHYWLNPKFNKNFINNRHWVWKTYKQWSVEFSFWGEKTVRRALDHLEQSGLLLTFKKRTNFKTVKHYSIDYERLNQLMVQCSSKPPSCGEELANNDVPSCKENPDMDVSNASSSPEEGSDASGSALDPKGLSSTFLPKTPENRGSHRDGQNDQPDVPVWANGGGQNDQVEVVKMTNIYNKDKKTTVKKNTLPPQENEEEEVSQKSLSILAESMVAIWNKAVQAKLQKSPVRLSKTLHLKLTNLLGEFFENDLARWKAYCDQISGCTFLMTRQESGFQVNFPWAIKPENILKVLNDAYYDRPQKAPKVSPEEFQKQIEEHCSENNYPKAWAEVCLRLSDLLGHPTVRSWLWELEPQEQGDELLLKAKTPFIRDYIRTTYLDKITDATRACFKTPMSVRVEVKSHG